MRTLWVCHSNSSRGGGKLKQLGPFNQQTSVLSRLTLVAALHTLPARQQGMRGPSLE